MTPVSIRHVAPNCLSTYISALTLLINDVIKEGGAVGGCGKMTGHSVIDH